MEVLTTETYLYSTLEEATEAAEQMRAERACDMAIMIDNTDKAHVKLIVQCGEVRG